ncbi:hypothetical protein JCM33374_g869 [Metschnikowia sp. JCM 33374]|nr:hypothetical protein JCM33374_g869 [Metschnikowia sp. JCM 33374]
MTTSQVMGHNGGNTLTPDTPYESGESPLARYGPAVQHGFFKHLFDLGELTIDHIDPTQDIAELADSIIYAFEEFIIDAESAGGSAETQLCSFIAEELKNCIIFKSFVVASDMSLFRRYFPDMTKYHSRFKRGNQTIAHALVQGIFPGLAEKTNLNARQRRDLGHVLAAVFSLAKMANTGGDLSAGVPCDEPITSASNPTEYSQKETAPLENTSPPTTAPEKASVVLIDGIKYKVDEGMDTSFIPSDCALSTSASVTVTNKKEYLTDRQEFSGVFFSDDEGNRYFSQCKGKLVFGKYTLTCYWVPTYPGSVVSMNDLAQISNHAFIAYKGSVYIRDAKLETFKEIGPTTDVGLVQMDVKVSPNQPDTRENVGRQDQDEGPSSFKIGKDAANSESSSNGIRTVPDGPATCILERFTLDMAQLIDGWYSSYSKDVFSTYIWTGYMETLDTTSNTNQNSYLQRSDMSSLRQYLSNVTKPVPSIIQTESVADTGKFMENTHTPIQNSTRTWFLMFGKALELLASATVNTTIERILQTIAIRHAVLLHNCTPDSKGRTPRMLLTGRKSPLAESFPLFGSDAVVKVTDETYLKDLQLKEPELRGIYVGTHPANTSVHLIWINYEQPAEKIRIVQTDSVRFTHRFTHMREAEKIMTAVESVIKAQTPFDSPAPSPYSNLKVPPSKQVGSFKTGESRKIMPISAMPDIVATILSPELLDTLAKQYSDYTRLKAKVAGLKSIYPSEMKTLMARTHIMVDDTEPTLTSGNFAHMDDTNTRLWELEAEVFGFQACAASLITIPELIERQGLPPKELLERIQNLESQIVLPKIHKPLLPTNVEADGPTALWNNGKPAISVLRQALERYIQESEMSAERVTPDSKKKTEKPAQEEGSRKNTKLEELSPGNYTRPSQAGHLNKAWEVHHSKIVYIHCLQRAFLEPDYFDQTIGKATETSTAEKSLVVVKSTRKNSVPRTKIWENAVVSTTRTRFFHSDVITARETLLEHTFLGPLVVQAEVDEIARLKEMDIFEEIDFDQVPKSVPIINSTYVHNLDDSDQYTKLKVQARCVVHHYTRATLPGDSFSAVVLPESVRAFIMTAVSRKMVIHQLDIGLAYFYQPLDQPVYVRPPKGVPGVSATKVWKCKKALYGLRNDDKSCYNTIRSKLEAYGFKQTVSHGIFTKTTARGTDIHAALYIDDLLVSVQDEEDYVDFRKYMALTAEIPVRDLGHIQEFCGVQFDSDIGGYYMHQKDFVEELLQKHEKFLLPRIQRCPIQNYDVHKDKSVLNEPEQSIYQELLGCYHWLAGITRPDIASEVSEFFSLRSNASKADLRQLKGMLMYLRHTKDFVIDINEEFYPNQKIKLLTILDDHWQKDGWATFKRGYILPTNATATVKSNKEGEPVQILYAALCIAENDVLWTKALFHELGAHIEHRPHSYDDFGKEQIPRNDKNDQTPKIEEKQETKSGPPSATEALPIGSADELKYSTCTGQPDYFGFGNRYNIRSISVKSHSEY